MTAKNIAWIIVMVAILFFIGVMTWFGHYFSALCPFIGMATARLERWIKKRRRNNLPFPTIKYEDAE